MSLDVGVHACVCVCVCACLCLCVCCMCAYECDHSVFFLYYTATASYRLLPDITLTKRVAGKSAHRLKKCFPEGVIEIRNEEGKASMV